MIARGRPGWLKPVLVVVTIAGCIGAIPAFLLLGVQGLDARSVSALALSAAIWAVPLLAILGIAAGWIAFARGRFALAGRAILLAAIPVLIEIGGTAWLMYLVDPAHRH